MSAYKIGQWTKSTLEALNYLVKQNLENKYPTITDIKKSDLLNKGTIINWVYLLKRSEAGFIKDENGLKLTDKGYNLFETLRNSPPSDRRKGIGRRKRKNKVKIIEKTTIPANRTPKENLYKINIQGVDLNLDMGISEEKAREIIKSLFESKNHDR